MAGRTGLGILSMFGITRVYGGTDNMEILIWAGLATMLAGLVAATLVSLTIPFGD